MDKVAIENFAKLWSETQKYMKKDPSIPPKIMVGGKSGSGKSSLLNALLKKNVFETGFGQPVTKYNKGADMQISDDLSITVIDAPGFGEAEKLTNENKDLYMKNIEEVAKQDINILLLVIDSTCRALRHEDDFLKHWFENKILKEIPIIVCLNKIDMVPPCRTWDPSKKINLGAPVSEKDKNLRAVVDYIQSLSSFKKIPQQNFLFVCAGEGNIKEDQYNIEYLNYKIYELLPESTRAMYARVTEDKKIISQAADGIINKYSAICAGAVAANFIPASDALILFPLQMVMIAKLGELYGLSMTESTVQGILTSVGASFAGRTACSVILSFIPGIKNLVGPPLAYALTRSMGYIVKNLMEQGMTVPAPELIERLAKQIDLPAVSQEEVMCEAAKYKE